MGSNRKLIPYALRQWPALVVIVALTAVASTIGVLQPWPLKILVDYALGSEPLPAWLLQASAWFGFDLTHMALVLLAGLSSIGLFALNSTLDMGLTWFWNLAGQRMVYDLAAALFARLQRLSLQFHTRFSVGESLSRLTGDSWSVYTIAQLLLIAPFRSIVTLLTVGIVAFRLDPLLTSLTFVMAPLMAAVAVYFGPRLKKRSRDRREAQARILTFVHQALTTMPVVQAFGAEASNVGQFQSLADDAVAVSQRSALTQSGYGFLNGLISTIGSAIVLFAGAERARAGSMTVGSLLVFIAYLQSIRSAFRKLFGMFGGLKQAEASSDRALEILESEDQVPERPGARPLPVRQRMVSGHVRLESVTFGYEPGRPVLHRVTLQARPGATVALVGATGVGKSTLVSLIPRFFDPWEGRVIMDGYDVRDVQLASVRQRVALVMQEPYLLPLSVADNIAYGRPGASRRAIELAAVAAEADEFVRQMPEGYATVIGERGATLSVGQRQRLAIARALLKDAPILILDEPTAALDAETEAEVMQALERLMVGRTTFIIAHRLSTIRRADQIVVLQEGRVVERGTHSELLAARGPYYRFHRAQFTSGPVEEVG
jgi:ATP-binding cassette subfamily B protein/subfamily B ATP-binding cassette protein MsbA